MARRTGKSSNLRDPKNLSSFVFFNSVYFFVSLPLRQDSRTVTLRNRTALPVSWRLQGVEELGDEFTVPQDHGIIPPKSSLPVTLHFRAKRPLHIKKVLRLEVRQRCRIITCGVSNQKKPTGISQESWCVDVSRCLFQVSDVEKILGVVHTENLQVSAEAYEIALDISPGRNHQSLLKLCFQY